MLEWLRPTIPETGLQAFPHFTQASFTLGRRKIPAPLTRLLGLFMAAPHAVTSVNQRSLGREDRSQTEHEHHDKQCKLFHVKSPIGIGFEHEGGRTLLDSYMTQADEVRSENFFNSTVFVIATRRVEHELHESHEWSRTLRVDLCDSCNSWPSALVTTYTHQLLYRRPRR